MFLKLVYLTLITLYRNQLVGIYYIKPFKLFHQDQEIFIHEVKKIVFQHGFKWWKIDSYVSIVVLV